MEKILFTIEVKDKSSKANISCYSEKEFTDILATFLLENYKEDDGVDNGPLFLKITDIEHSEKNRTIKVEKETTLNQFLKDLSGINEDLY